MRHCARLQLIPHARGHRAQEGWDPSVRDGILQPCLITIATHLDPADLSNGKSADAMIRLPAEVWTGPHGHCCKKCNYVGGRGTASAVDGIDAEFSACASQSSPQPRSGAPKA